MAAKKVKVSNRNLSAARKSKNDEFYTQLPVIENELKYYKKKFEGKTVLCNCDDPRESNFVNYLSLNFEHLKLKKLIATHFKESNIFTTESPYKLEYTGDKNGNNVPDSSEFVTKLLDDGDFRSPECEDLLEEADIVVTNPPFSLFREYVDQLMQFKKKFLILGNLNAITYKDIFPLIKENKLWLGPSISSGDREFRVPNNYPLNAAGCRVDEDGNKYIRVKGVRWFTNLSHEKRNEELTLYKKYSPKEYSKYDNYDAINVNKVVEIPMDYEGVMGVPITFLDKYNPKQFEILGQMVSTTVNEFNFGYPYVKSKKIYARIIIKNLKVKK